MVWQVESAGSTEAASGKKVEVSPKAQIVQLEKQRILCIAQGTRVQWVERICIAQGTNCAEGGNELIASMLIIRTFVCMYIFLYKFFIYSSASNSFKQSSRIFNVSITCRYL